MDNNIIFQDYLVDFFDTKIQGKKAITTEKDYEIIIYKYIRTYFLLTKIKDIKLEDVEDYFYNFLKFRKLSDSTIRKHYAVLNAVFEELLKDDLIKENFCSKIKLPKVQKREIPKLSIEEIRDLLDKSKENDNIKIQVCLAINLGLKLGEVLGLQWDDVNFKKNTININKTLNVVDKEIIIKNLKSKERELIANKEVMNMLKEESIRQNQEKLKGNYNELDLVCVNGIGECVNPRTFSKNFDYWYVKKYSKQMRFQDLRHANAILMLKNGVSPKVVSERLGHSKISTTTSFYSETLKELDKDALKTLDNILYK